MSSHSDPCKQLSRNQTQALSGDLTSSSSDTSRARRAPTDAAMTFSTASSSEKRSKKRKPASSNRRRTLPFNEEANSPALAWKVPDRARVKAVSSQLDTSLGCHISTFCIFASFHFYCKAAELCEGYSSYSLSSIHSTEEHNCSFLMQEILLSKVCTHLLTSLCSVPSPFSKPPSSFFSIPVPLEGMLALPPKVR